MNPTDPGPPGDLVTYAYGQPEYLPLVARQINSGQRVRTRWQLTNEERKRVAEGADIILDLTTFGQPLQPIHLELADDPPILEEANPE